MHPPEKKEAAEVAPAAAVITLEGLCLKPATPAAECKTVVTRAQFEKLADALTPNMPEPRRRQLANAYTQMLVLSENAEKRGLDKKPDTQEILHFARLQALSQILLRDLQEEAKKVPPAEEQKYYDEHKDNYSEATLQRIFLPKNPPEATAPADEKAKAEREATIKAEAAKIQTAAAAGEDFDKLQKQVYDDFGMKTTPPPTQAGVMRRGSLPPAQATVFDLQPGQVSAPLDTPGGFYVYKLVSKKTLTLPEVRSEIDRVLEGERMQKLMESMTGSVKPVFNEAYFGPMQAEGPAIGPAHGRPPAATPPKSPPPAPPK